jgi:hypothetical protein
VTGLWRPLSMLRLGACAAVLTVALTVCVAQEPPPVIPESEASTPGHEAAQEAAPATLFPTDIRAEVPRDKDTGAFTDDSGAEANVSWRAPTAEPPPGQELKGYRIYRATGNGEFKGLLEPVTKPDEITEEGKAPHLGSHVTDLWSWYVPLQGRGAVRRAGRPALVHEGADSARSGPPARRAVRG